MKIIDRHICRGFLFAYVVSLGIMMSLYAMMDLFLNFDEFTELRWDGTEYGTIQVVKNILNYYGYNLFLYFSQLAGTISVVAALVTVGIMLRNNELTALLASGVSMYRVAAPLIIMAMLSHCLWILDHEFVLPRIAHKLARTHDDIEGAKTLSVWFYRASKPDGGSDLISATTFDRRSKRMEDVIIIERNANGRALSTIHADQAQWISSEERWDLSGGHGGVRQSFRTVGRGPFAIDGGIERERVSHYPDRVRPRDLELRQDSDHFQFLSFRELNTLSRREDLVDRATVARTKHERITAPVINVLLLVLALPWFLTSIPEKLIRCSARALVVYTCALVFSVICINAGPEGYEAIFCWLPIIALTPVAIFVVDAVRT
jgi:lipopolysaccharide export LptBFGC system permease protein LptF